MARRKARMVVVEGFDGHEVHIRSRPIPGTRRVQETATRCLPGTFLWRYGRAEPGTTLDMLYHAGVEFSRLWERAGLDGPSTVDWAKAGTTQWKGLPDARVLAMDEVKTMTQELGKMVTTRLVHYTVQGKTNRAIARIYGYPEREMSAILNADLTAAARHFQYLR